VKAILRWFKLISGLKVKFFESKIYGINIDDGFLKCNIGRLPFIYLGLPVGAIPRRATTRKPML
jgi:hypothetical protein